MNPELNKLAVEYSQTKNANLFPAIFKIIEPILKKKAEFVFYQKTFRGHFKLVDMKQNTLDDVKQDLVVEVIKLLKKYKPEQSFSTYLISSLWKWTPKYTRKNKFFKYLKNKSMNIIGEDGEEKSLIDDIPQTSHFEGNLVDLFENLTETEIKIVNLFQENNNINQSEIAGIVSLTQQRVSQIFQGLKKKYIG